MNLVVQRGGLMWVSSPGGQFVESEEIPLLELPPEQSRTEKIRIDGGELMINGERVSPEFAEVVEFHLLSRGPDVYFVARVGGSEQVFRWSPINGSEQLTSRRGSFRCLPNRDGESIALVFEDFESGAVSLLRMDGPKMSRIF